MPSMRVMCQQCRQEADYETAQQEGWLIVEADNVTAFALCPKHIADGVRRFVGAHLSAGIKLNDGYLRSKTQFADMRALLIALAAHGPTGIRRPCRSILSRLGEEKAELGEALGGSTNHAHILEEAGDTLYYHALAVANRCNVAQSPDNLVNWRRIADALGMAHSVDAIRAAYIASVVKYHVRFVLNKGGKDHQAEWAAILEAVRPSSVSMSCISTG